MKINRRPTKLANEKNYRWDKILKITELAELCSNGNHAIQTEMLDTLERYPVEQLRNLVRPKKSCSLFLWDGLQFLKDEGYQLPEWTFSITKPDSLPPRLSTERASERNDHPTFVEQPEAYVLYLAEHILQYPKPTAKERRRQILKIIKGVDGEAKTKAQTHFEEWDGQLTFKGTNQPFADSTWSAHIKKAKDFIKNSR